MKFNWGHGIAIFMTLFIIAIVSAVYYTSIQVTELVTEDYYQQEIAYQEVINAKKNSDKILDSIQYSIDTEFIRLSFVNSLNISEAKGQISFYRPNNSDLDLNFDINKVLFNDEIIISKDKFVTGIYDLSIHWNLNDETYIWEKSIKL